MAAIFAFTCSCCGRIHEGSPSFAFTAPDHYVNMTDEEKVAKGQLSSDFCVITHQDQTDYFVRAVLEVPIHGIEEPFTWGVWVSLSKKSYDRYTETYDSPVEGEGFFGWLCNSLPVYPDTDRKTDVRVQLGGLRPLLFLHRTGQETDQLVIDQYEGIPVARAQALAEQAMHAQ